jgi:hypothetical protein
MNSKRAREDLSSKSDTSDQDDPDYAFESKQTKKTYISFEIIISAFSLIGTVAYALD